MSDYEAFLERKRQLANAGGFEPEDMPGHLDSLNVSGAEVVEDVALFEDAL